jgi:hypothetical protein
LRSCEQSLLDPAVRRDRAHVEQFLAEDFEEFGASGRVWTRTEILDELANERYVPPTIEDFRCVMIADAVALVTYRSVKSSGHAEAQITSLRSSIWTKKDGFWKLRFHQGTPVP